MIDTRLLPWALAQAALKDGWDRQAVQIALLSRIQRDQAYLARRKQSGQHTTFDAKTERDLLAMALAVCWLVEDTTSATDIPTT